MGSGERNKADPARVVRLVRDQKLDRMSTQRDAETAAEELDDAVGVQHSRVVGVVGVGKAPDPASGGGGEDLHAVPPSRMGWELVVGAPSSSSFR